MATGALKAARREMSLASARSATHTRLQVGRVAVARDGDFGDRCLDLRQVLVAERERRRSEVLCQAVQLGRAGDRRDPWLLLEEPG